VYCKNKKPGSEEKMAEPPAYPGTPRWVKISALVAGIVVLLIAVVLLTGIGGPHGPGRHLPGGGAEPPLSDGTGNPS
jgi:hypothetical protein